MTDTSKSILVVDDDTVILKSLCDFLRKEGFEVAEANSYRNAVKELQLNSYNLVLTDVRLPDGNGFDLMDMIKDNFPQTVVIIITGYGSIESAVQSIKRGAYDYLTKPIVDDELRLSVSRALQQQNLMSENENLRSQLDRKYSLENFMSHDYKMARIFDLIQAVADSKTTILMTGQSGTGKSMLARIIHHLSGRRHRPFVEVSCGALPETLLESELFGHVKGAFTGAVSHKEGKFRAADGGTIFLDEISNASPALEVKLLRVLQDRAFEPVGSNKTITVDTRIILATNRDLKKLVEKGQFREDLYYRINVVAIDLPPLNERIGDIPLLADHFLKHYSTQHHKVKLGFTDDAMEQLEQYPWPGNVRELENVIERAALLSKGKTIDTEDLPDVIRQQTPASSASFEPVKSLKEALAEPEKNIIRQALAAYHWNRQKTAAALKINRTTLFKKMKQYDLYEEGEKLGLL